MSIQPLCSCQMTAWEGVLIKDGVSGTNTIFNCSILLIRNGHVWDLAESLTFSVLNTTSNGIIDAHFSIKNIIQMLFINF